MPAVPIAIFSNLMQLKRNPQKVTQREPECRNGAPESQNAGPRSVDSLALSTPISALQLAFRRSLLCVNPPTPAIKTRILVCGLSLGPRLPPSPAFLRRGCSPDTLIDYGNGRPDLDSHATAAKAPTCR